jgi:hypothetical protein
MNRRAVMSWIAKCGFGALLVMIACGIATTVLGNRLQLTPVTTRDGTLIAMNRYLNEPVPDVVLAGSSLSYRLKEEYFASRARNLSLPGGSPVTALAIAVNQQHLPKVILVESNLLARPPDDALVARYSAGGQADQLVLRPVRTAVAAYESWMHAPPSHDEVAHDIRRLLAEPPSSFDNRLYIDRVVERQNMEDPTDGLRDSIARTKALIAVAEGRGIRVFLYELPVPERVSRTRSQGITHDSVHAAFAEPERWLALKLPRDELRWADGFHLDERSAVIVTQAIDAALAAPR